MVEQFRPRKPSARVFDEQSLQEVTQQRRELVWPADRVVNDHVNELVQAVSKERRLADVQFIQDTGQRPDTQPGNVA